MAAVRVWNVQAPYRVGCTIGGTPDFRSAPWRRSGAEGGCRALPIDARKRSQVLGWVAARIARDTKVKSPTCGPQDSHGGTFTPKGSRRKEKVT